MSVGIKIRSEARYCTRPYCPIAYCSYTLSLTQTLSTSNDTAVFMHLQSPHKHTLVQPKDMYRDISATMTIQEKKIHTRCSNSKAASEAQEAFVALSVILIYGMNRVPRKLRGFIAAMLSCADEQTKHQNEPPLRPAATQGLRGCRAQPRFQAANA